MIQPPLLPIFLCLWAGAAHGADWGCLDPQPGHPTASERAAFVRQASALALAAEKKHGVPAAALAAMAVVESRYGFTRVALEARNPLGWKFNGAKAAGGRKPYVLACQPRNERNKRYVTFASRADAFDFVAARLATRAPYRAPTLAYQRARASGAPPAVSVGSWVRAIASPYSHHPSDYAAAVLRTMNEHQLLALSKPAVPPVAALAQAVAAVPALEVAPIERGDELAQATAYFASRLPQRECDLPEINLLHWEGFPVQSCSYTHSGVTARAYTLNAAPEQLARWTVTACRDAHARPLAACTAYMAAHIMATSGAVFPVAGFLPQAGRGANAPALCALYRDGVAISTDRWREARRPQGELCGGAEEADQPLRQAEGVARIAATGRSALQAVPGAGTRTSDSGADLRWLETVRQAYQQAWGQDRNVLVSASAKLAKGHAFP